MGLARFGVGGSSDLGETGPVEIVLLPAHATPRMRHLTYGATALRYLKTPHRAG
jgi:hypothetical protein